MASTGFALQRGAHRSAHAPQRMAVTERLVGSARPCVSASAPPWRAAGGACSGRAPALPPPCSASCISSGSSTTAGAQSNLLYPRRRCLGPKRSVAIRAAAGAAPGPGPTDSTGPSSGPADGRSRDPPRVSEPSTALLLAWFACGNRSLFAAQCLVEALVELYREGRSFGELQLSIKLATQAGGGGEGRGSVEDAGGSVVAEAGPGHQAPLLTAQDEDVLVSWVALVFLTLEELGVPRDRDPQAAQQRQQQQGHGAGDQPRSSGSGSGGGVGPSGPSSIAGRSAYLTGMLGYVRQTLGLYEGGQTLAAVAGLQGLAAQASSSAPSPSLLLMQQYTRLVLLTVEVAAAAGLATARPLRAPGTVTRPSGYSEAFSPACALPPPPPLQISPSLPSAPLPPAGSASAASAAAAASPAASCSPRGLAVRLLMAFTGAVLGSPWSLGKFVEGVRVAYDQGLSADELFSQLDEEEFLQSGGLLPVAPTPATTAPGAAAAAAGEGPTSAAAPPSAAEPQQQPATAAAPQHAITKKLLSSWISLSYMTLAQLAVPYPAARQKLGWAWAGFGDPVEALGMNDFVANVLRQMAGQDPRVIQPPQLQPEPPAEPPGQQQGPVSVAGGVDEQQEVAEATAADAAGAEAAETADGEAVLPGGRRRGGAFMVRVEDNSLPSTSTAFRVLSQQVALVQAVCRSVMRF